MTRKDYQLIADAIKAGKPDISEGENVRKQHKLTTAYICSALRRDNTRFDREKFLTACGYAAD